MKERKQKTLVYKRARFVTDGPILKRLLSDALQQEGTVGARREPLAPGGESPIWRLIGQFRIEDQFVFGVLMRYMPGLSPAFVVDDEDARTLTVEQLSAPANDEGKRRELVEGMLFFGAIDNHVVMMQSLSLRSDHLEAHLQWLLHRSNVLDGTNTVHLVDQVPLQTREALAQSGVQSLQIGGELVGATQPARSKGGTKHEKGTETSEAVTYKRSAGFSAVFDALRTLVGPDEAAKLDEEALTGSNIQYTLRIKLPHRTTDDGQELMNALGSALRHAEGVDATIHLANGGRLRGDDLRLTGPVKIEAYDGIPSADEVFEVMRSWLLDKVKQGDLVA